ncbi:Hypothetical protein, putative [Bodo saltans]|uniref:Uncharacterized protein n=1 Tax=Bodo saltans TaxID=75058 RepID=A0A0S4JKW2_BODSA|nr:Hypothetical protein, putative [Bodo saltans]|eukprot:CUG92172.1 Hypothetical protein, putative [Bodo saltans]
MIRARIYLEGKILLRLIVDETTVFSSDEDQSGDFSKIRIVDTSWKSTSSNVHEISAKVGCVRQNPVCYIKETSTVTVVAIFGSPLFLAHDVYLVMMPVERGSPLMRLQELHKRTLQKLCRTGPGPPFGQLCVKRKEWADSYACGVECRSAMISNVARYHLTRASRKLSKQPNEHVSFVVYAEGCEVIFVESPITSRCDVNSDQIVEVRFEDSHAVSGRLRSRSRGFRVSIRCTGDCCADGSVHRTVIESPDFFTPYPLTPRGSILFFRIDDARCCPRLGPLSHEHATVSSGSYTLEVVCMP